MVRASTVSVTALSLLLACVGEDTGRRPPPPPPGDGDADADSDGDGDGDAGECFDDSDGDGYGVLCPAGEDCNDLDPERHDDCSSCRPGIPQLDCPCFGTEDPVECESEKLYYDEHGRLRCRKGLQSCVANVEAAPDTGFAWTDCLNDQGLPIDDDSGI